METAFAKPAGDVLASFNVNENTGLSDAQVTELRSKHGRNSIPEEPPTPLWELILEQFKDQLVIILLGSAAVSFVLALFDEEEGWSAFVDPIVILTILILNGVVGVSQESSAEKAIAALQEYSANEANVVRNGGQVSRVKAEELVPGDIVTVHIGDRIPADCRLVSIESNSFSVDQAVLTGESESVGKRASTVVEDDKAVLQDQTNMLFSGTTVVTGRARAVVVLTGSNTAIGDIHESITAQISEPTPLKQKLNDFGDKLAKVITVICILVWLINIPNFNDPSHGNWTKGAIYYLKIAVSLGVAAIPEGLAVVITTCLALGTRKMAAKNAVVRSLPSVETLGSCSVICSDKTGTLTTNQMSVSKVVHLNEDGSDLSELDVEGTTFAPRGSIKASGVIVRDLHITSNTIRQMTQVAAICNDAQLAYDSQSATFSSIGEPTEGALRVLVEKIGPCAPTDTRPEDCVHYASATYQKEFPRLATYEFSRDRKSMSVLVGNGSSKKLLVKGAPESVIDRCTETLVGSNGKKVPLTKKISDRLMTEIVRYGNNGLRVIALASIDNVPENPLLQTADSTEQYAQLEQNMTFLGLVCMLDPPREEVPHAVKQCKDAGIRIIVITGDNRNTAESICRQIGVFGQHEDLTGKSYTGREFDQLSPNEQLEAAKRASLFSRVEPSHKSRLVDLLQSLGEVVAMTGDGVNDAPALKKADIVESSDITMFVNDYNYEVNSVIDELLEPLQENHPYWECMDASLGRLFSCEIPSWERSNLEPVTRAISIVKRLPKSSLPLSSDLWSTLESDEAEGADSSTHTSRESQWEKHEATTMVDSNTIRLALLTAFLGQKSHRGICDTADVYSNLLSEIMDRITAKKKSASMKDDRSLSDNSYHNTLDCMATMAASIRILSIRNQVGPRAYGRRLGRALIE
ncbi:ca2+ transporting sarcoplasmic endoplasmic reticulum [Fusarium langsethiae]|uniref:Ca2+ transporting sarcoplasmic endoplasmic reticulum n=1 Tax=Fusarium langsethiae TaxID=179993 RepID=A0A0N0V7H8_FUSLA|nr:ca2+ transporting sarcoplasmic endoplasmic reticulum [Fusarium langsethiae]